ncbi:MAG: hypothetical protein KDA78_14290, partial [Planctomycetaceae bacterium]|nr:hypothetical protein [Planctomycetaceae bacterium]
RLVNRFRVSKSEKQATEMLEEIDTRMSKKAPKPKKETKPVVKHHHEDEEAEELIPFGDDNDFSDF